jgi:hypothetical protein
MIFPERNLLHLPVRFPHTVAKPFVDGSQRTGVIGKLQVTSPVLINTQIMLIVTVTADIPILYW